MHVADDLIQGIAVNRQARVSEFPGRGERLLDGCARFQGDDARVGRHHVTSGEARIIKDTRDHALLDGEKDPLGGTCAHQHLDLLRAGAVIIARIGVPQAQDQVGREKQEADRPGSDAGEKFEETCHSHGPALGLANGQALGHQLTQQQGGIGDSHHNYCQGDLGSVGLQERDFFQQGSQHAGSLDTTHCRCQGGHHGDADLHGCQEFARLALQVEGPGGARVAPLGLCLQAGLAGGHHGDLRRSEKSVQQD